MIGRFFTLIAIALLMLVWTERSSAQPRPDMVHSLGVVGTVQAWTPRACIEGCSPLVSFAVTREDGTTVVLSMADDDPVVDIFRGIQKQQLRTMVVIMPVIDAGR